MDLKTKNQASPAPPLSKSYFPGSGVVIENIVFGADQTSRVFEARPGWACQLIGCRATVLMDGTQTGLHHYWTITDEAAGNSVWQFETGAGATNAGAVPHTGTGWPGIPRGDSDNFSNDFRSWGPTPEVWLAGRFTVTYSPASDAAAGDPLVGPVVIQLLYRRVQDN